jgi:AcrR family transcriptional regulator
MPARARQLPQTRVTRDDWVRAASTTFREVGISGVKVARLAEQLQVGRSSFYWYFADRAELDSALLEAWEAHNVAPLVERAAAAAPTVTAAVLGLFECWADPALFDHRVEFAVRDWARLDDCVRQRLERADSTRIGAIAELHRRYGDDPVTAEVRARVQYHSQIGMYALGLDEPVEERLRMLPTYLTVFTGATASADELAAFTEWVHRQSGA